MESIPKLTDFPTEPEVDVLYLFEKVENEKVLFARYMRFGDGSAKISGDLDYRCEEYTDAWRSGLKIIAQRGFSCVRSEGSFPLNDFLRGIDPDDIAGQIQASRKWGQILKYGPKGRE